MNKVKFINSFSFVFSARPGTPAFKLKGFDEKEAKNRLIQFPKNCRKNKKNYRKN